MSSNEDLEMRLRQLAKLITEKLRSESQKCVFAESCTGGKMAAAMTAVAGISNHFCGSAVTYREATKSQWLQVDPETIETHTAESQQVTTEMAKGVLRNTEEASVAVAITGHLGPGAPDPIDGIVFVSVAGVNEIRCRQFKLQSSDRCSRQTEAACLALEFFLK